jgi:hypothetical protein
MRASLTTLDNDPRRLGPDESAVTDGVTIAPT